MFRTGKPWSLAVIGVLSSPALILGQGARADTSVRFTAQVDQPKIGLGDTVSLKLNLQAAGNSSVGDPTFDAPDFEVVNSYDSTYVESYYNQGTNQFETKNRREMTRILRPLRPGALRISHIRVTVGGQSLSAPDVLVNVGPGGTGGPSQPPTPGAGGGGPAPGDTVKADSHAGIFVRAEVDRDKVFKGEQVVVSYYLYRRVRAMNLQVSRFPTLNGFLREELEMPVMQPRLDSEPVVLGGVPYQRSLLARYAAYPLQVGRLQVDPLGLKFSYFGDTGLNDDGQDPFLNFFRQLTPREGTGQSDPVYVRVLPLPTEGRPAGFSGGVGDFSIASAVDRYTVRANEPLTLTVKIEGRGNVAAIGEPKAIWPSQIEYYDSKGTVHSGKGGVGSKIFEILLIPRKAGALTLPPMELSYFDPSQERYIVKTTEPIPITVAEAASGAGTPTLSDSSPAIHSDSGSPDSSSEGKRDGESLAPALRELKPPVGAVPGWTDRFPLWRVLYDLVAAVGVFLLILIGKRMADDAGARRRERQAESGESLSARLADLRVRAASPSLAGKDVTAAYERLHALALETLDRNYGVGARSLPREELGRVLVQEKGLDPDQWDRVQALLEDAERVRFCGASASEVQQGDRERLDRWIDVLEGGLKNP